MPNDAEPAILQAAAYSEIQTGTITGREDFSNYNHRDGIEWFGKLNYTGDGNLALQIEPGKPAFAMAVPRNMDTGI